MKKIIVLLFLLFSFGCESPKPDEEKGNIIPPAPNVDTIALSSANYIKVIPYTNNGKDYLIFVGFTYMGHSSNNNITCITVTEVKG